MEDIFHLDERIVTDTVEWHGAEHLVVAVTDPNSGRHLISLTDVEGLTAAIADLRNTMIAVLVMVISIVIPGSFFLARQISRPVNRIVEKASALLPQSEPEENLPVSNEFEYLDGVLKYFGRRVNELQYSMEERRQSDHTDALRHWIDGTGEADELRGEIPPALHGAEGYVVTVVRFDGYRNLIEAVDGQMVRSMNRTVGETVLVAFDRSAAYVDLGGDSGAIIHGTVGGSPDRDALEAGYAAVLQRVESTMERSVTIGIGTAVDSLHELPNAYGEARSASDYRFRFGAGSVIHYEAIEPHGEDYRFPEEVARHLLEMLRLGKTDTAVEMMNGIMEDVKSATFDDFQFAVQMLIRMTRRELLDKIPDSVTTDRTLRSVVDELSRVDTADEAAEIFGSAFRLFGESMDHDREQRVQTIVHRVNRLSMNQCLIST